jgi:G3E family GTPase
MSCFFRQIALADVLLVNKMDLTAAKDNITTLEQHIRILNPTAPLIRTTQGKVDLAQVLNTGAYNSFKPESVAQADSHTHPYDHTHEHDEKCHQHDLESISSVQISIPALSETQVSKLDEWIRSVLWEKTLPGAAIEVRSVEVLRCKGIYYTTGGKPYILQGVQTLYDVTELLERHSDGSVNEGKLVLIGRGLTSKVAQSLKEYLGLV